MRMKDAAVATEVGRSPAEGATAALASVRWNRRRLAEAVAAARIEGLHANEEPRPCRAHTSPTAR